MKKRNSTPNYLIQADFGTTGIQQSLSMFGKTMLLVHNDLQNWNTGKKIQLRQI